MSRPYTGTKDGVAKRKRPGTERFQQLLCKHYGLKNLGTFVVRQMRNGNGLSVHATARAGDSGGKTSKALEAIADELAAHADLLELEELHNYSYGKWGRGWRCDRHAWKVYRNRAESAGSPGGRWLHWELSPAMADDAHRVEAAFAKFVEATAKPSEA